MSDFDLLDFLPIQLKWLFDLFLQKIFLNIWKNIAIDLVLKINKQYGESFIGVVDGFGIWLDVFEILFDLVFLCCLQKELVVMFPELLPIGNDDFDEIWPLN
jgi:hypothetical protein